MSLVMRFNLSPYQARSLYHIGDMKRAHNRLYARYYLLACQKIEEEAEEDAQDNPEEGLDKLR